MILEKDERSILNIELNVKFCTQQSAWRPCLSPGVVSHGACTDRCSQLIKKMEFWNTKSEDFLKRGAEIIKKQGEVLVLIRYPYQAGNKDFVFIESESKFKKFIDGRGPKESVTLFKSIENVSEGLVTEDYIAQTLNKLSTPKSSDWIVIFPRIKDKIENWYYDENKVELEESLRLHVTTQRA